MILLNKKKLSLSNKIASIYRFIVQIGLYNAPEATFWRAVKNMFIDLHTRHLRDGERQDLVGKSYNEYIELTRKLGLWVSPRYAA